MRVEKAIRLRYGRFFYRFPNGESAADVYDRITGNAQNLHLLLLSFFFLIFREYGSSVQLN
jgi:hypothetical protein